MSLDDAPIDWDVLRAEAQAARAHAHAPYSGFAVGAAIRTADGRTFAGANVENASYGLTLCAERSAVAAAVSAGARDLRALVVVAPGAAPVPPCGACRQFLVEFAPALPIRCCTPDGAVWDTDLAALFPEPFGAGHVQHEP